jgi:hypothetical protein
MNRVIEEGLVLADDIWKMLDLMNNICMEIN